MFAGITDTCGMGTMWAKTPRNQRPTQRPRSSTKLHEHGYWRRFEELTARLPVLVNRRAMASFDGAPRRRRRSR